VSARYLATESARLQARPPSYVVHEFLERENRAMLFADFVAAAEGAGLRYVCDTDLRTRYPELLGGEVAEALADLGGVVEREQYLDFVVNRNFRRSLLCLGSARPAAEPRLDRIEDMQFAASLAPPKKLDLRRPRPAPFSRPEGGSVEVHHPLTKAALLHLARRYPDSLAVAELEPLAVREVQAAGAGGLAGDTGHLVSELFGLVVAGAAELLHQERRVPRPPAESPAVTPLARAQAARPDRRLATRLHTVLALDDFAAGLVRRLDGTRTVGAVTEELLAEVASGRLVLEGVAVGAAAEPRVRELVARNVERLVGRFAHSGLLTAATAVCD